MPSLPLEGRTVVVTGTVPGLDRDAAKQAVVDLGGKAGASVGPKTDLVVVGDGAGEAKLVKARQQATPVLDAAAFAVLAENPDSWDGRPLGAPLPGSAGQPSGGEHPPARRAPEEGNGHHVSTASWTRDGVWTVSATCTCGQRWTAARISEVGRCADGP